MGYSLGFRAIILPTLEGLGSTHHRKSQAQELLPSTPFFSRRGDSTGYGVIVGSRVYSLVCIADASGLSAASVSPLRANLEAFPFLEPNSLPESQFTGVRMLLYIDTSRKESTVRTLLDATKKQPSTLRALKIHPPPFPGDRPVLGAGGSGPRSSICLTLDSVMWRFLQKVSV